MDPGGVTDCWAGEALFSEPGACSSELTLTEGGPEIGFASCCQWSPLTHRLQRGVLEYAKGPAGLARLLRHEARPLLCGPGVTQRRPCGIPFCAFLGIPRVHLAGRRRRRLGATVPAKALFLLLTGSCRNPAPPLPLRRDGPGDLLPGTETAVSFVLRSIGSVP